MTPNILVSKFYDPPYFSFQKFMTPAQFIWDLTLHSEENDSPFEKNKVPVTCVMLCEYHSLHGKLRSERSSKKLKSILQVAEWVTLLRLLFGVYHY